LKPVTKFSAEASSAERMGEVMANAFRTAESDRPGAAFVNLPKDNMEEDARCEALDVPARPAFGPGSRESLDEAAKIAKGAERPIVLLGLAASRPENAEAVRTFLGKSHIPVVGTFQAAGTVSSDLFQSFAGRVGQLDNAPGDELLAASDVIITVGYDPVEYDPSIWNRRRNAKIIHIDSTRADIDNFYSPVVEVLGDIAASLRELETLVGSVVLTADSEILVEDPVLPRLQGPVSGVPTYTKGNFSFCERSNVERLRKKRTPEGQKQHDERGKLKRKLLN
jgi:acetolactate synthase-1/2/3 large subunit